MRDILLTLNLQHQQHTQPQCPWFARYMTGLLVDDRMLCSNDITMPQLTQQLPLLLSLCCISDTLTPQRTQLKPEHTPLASLSQLPTALIVLLHPNLPHTLTPPFHCPDVWLDAVSVSTQSTRHIHRFLLCLRCNPSIALCTRPKPCHPPFLAGPHPTTAVAGTDPICQPCKEVQGSNAAQALESL